MSLNTPTFTVREDKPFRLVIPDNVYYTPCTLTPEQTSTIWQVDQIHESVVEIANMLTDNISRTLSTETLRIIEDYVMCSCPTHFYIEEKLLKTFFPELLHEHKYEHNTFINRIEGVEMKLVISPAEAQQYLTNVLLNLILDHFLLQDIPWIDMYKTLLSQEEREQFAFDIDISSFSDTPATDNFQ